MSPSLERAFEESWPAAEYIETGGLRTGRGLGGGMRVSSTRPTGSECHEDDIDRAVEIHQGWSQNPAFRVPEGHPLEEILKTRDWQPNTRTLILSAAVTELADRDIPPVTSFAIWPPLAIQKELWTEQGIGAARQEIMSRVELPKTSILGRIDDRAAGTAFVAAARDHAALHALEVIETQRRKGLAGWIVRNAAFWAQQQGCKTMFLAVTAQNRPAIALYKTLGFSEIAAYHYWQR
ncbi:GNAT family N-acetyltransferase [Paracoccus aerodenitrificans]|uniref:GNAT family N-acetyltransferase n=1 Tax=Paracoccus aerodenitrificans TaxID=3017781 RepID=UPI0022F12294|nr:GNAT family N-acetyltransferase [Paracoccus aerodenitrificans]WBU62988.1 GNAT family N-acetyltransferase [Paracoccus aerodenitrificans]